VTAATPPRYTPSKVSPIRGNYQPTSTFSCRFAFSVSPRGSLSCDDAGRLTRCHRALVSNSCHFFRTPQPSVGDVPNRCGTRTNPFRRFRHVTAIPEVALPRSPVSVGDEWSSSTVHRVLATVDSLSISTSPMRCTHSRPPRGRLTYHRLSTTTASCIAMQCLSVHS
jgi:hypothetical protein